MSNYATPGAYIAIISCASNVAMARYAKKQSDQAGISEDMSKRVSRIEDGVSDLSKQMMLN
jgi:hypothetical protein